MRLNVAFGVVSAALVGLVLAQNQPPRQVAVIGAGAAGCSAAYHLHKIAAEAGVNVNITLFEKTDHIGGRTLTINPFNDPAQRVEQGASIFIPSNFILYDAMNEFGLSPRAPEVNADPNVGIWDGDCFVFQFDRSAPSWWNNLKIILKYGLTAPQRTDALVNATFSKFLGFYDPQSFPFRSLTQRVRQLNLTGVSGVTGEQILHDSGVGDRFAHDIIQSNTRVNYASNLANMQGVPAIVSLAGAGALSVQGGNWQIFHEMVQRSGAGVALNTAVAAIDKTSSGSQYTVQTTSGSAPGSSTTYPVTFDNVIIANPYQFSGISAGQGVLQTPIEKVPYVSLHVTIFTTPKRISPGFFDLPASASVPGVILTTLAQGDTPNSGVDGAGKAGFFSITAIGNATKPQTHQRENVYKIFSPQEITPDFLTRLLGATVPSSFTGGNSPITWYTPHVFNSYPKTFPRTTFQDHVLGGGIYYTSGMEGFLSCMETSALMGKNVARLIVNDIVAA